MIMAHRTPATAKQQQEHQQRPRRPQRRQQKKNSGSFKYVPFTEQQPQKFIDTHCHIDLICNMATQSTQNCLVDYDLLKKECLGANFSSCLNVCCFLESFPLCEDLQNRYSEIYASYGIHPHDAKSYTDEIEARIIRNMSLPRTIAWGECGLDYAKNLSPHDVQQRVFARQCCKAVEIDVPLILHLRDADEDAERILFQCVPPHHRIHLHCYTSGPRLVLSLLEKYPNLMVGFTGAATFPSASKIRDSVCAVPRDRILVETDGPFMAPIPYRGHIAHPGHIPTIAEALAKMRGEAGIDGQEFLKCAIRNAQRLYGCSFGVDEA